MKAKILSFKIAMRYAVPLKIFFLLVALYFANHAFNIISEGQYVTRSGAVSTPKEYSFLFYLYFIRSVFFSVLAGHYSLAGVKIER